MTKAIKVMLIVAATRAVLSFVRSLLFKFPGSSERTHVPPKT